MTKDQARKYKLAANLVISALIILLLGRIVFDTEAFFTQLFTAAQKAGHHINTTLYQSKP